MMILALLVAIFLAIIIYYLGYRCVDPIYENEFVGGYITGAIVMTVGAAIFTFFLTLGG